MQVNKANPKHEQEAYEYTMRCATGGQDYSTYLAALEGPSVLEIVSILRKVVQITTEIPFVPESLIQELSKTLKDWEGK